MEKTYYIKTFGCQMNVHESEKIAGILRQRDYIETASEKFADVIVYNTCCIRESAEDHILGNIGVVKKLKEKNPNLIFAVCGCMTQKEGAAESLIKRCPFINIIFGTYNLHKFGDYLDNLSKKPIIEIWSKESDIVEDIPVYRTSGVNAYVNIMYGCNNFCTYCIVPYVKGRERSRCAEEIIKEVSGLVESHKIITLLGQNVNSYGNDLEKGIKFADLLNKVSKISGKFRINFMTSHPKDLSEDVIKVIAENEKLSKFIHLPIQSGSDTVLKRMNRRYTSKEYLNKIEMIRRYMPNAGLSSDIIVGFPGETESDFEDTIKIIKQVEFNNLYTFLYSRRSGTPADKMEQVDENVKNERFARLLEVQAEIGAKLSQACVGKEYEMICESVGDGKSYGKTDCGKFVTVNGNIGVGNFAKVKILSRKNSKLFGEII